MNDEKSTPVNTKPEEQEGGISIEAERSGAEKLTWKKASDSIVSRLNLKKASVFVKDILKRFKIPDSAKKAWKAAREKLGQNPGFVILALLMLALAAAIATAVISRNSADYVPPAGLDLNAEMHFQDAVIILTGIGGLSPDELEAGLSIEPEVRFDIGFVDSVNQSAGLYLQGPLRGIPYLLTFEKELGIDDDGEPEIYRYETVLNGPEMKVSLRLSRLADENAPVVLYFTEEVNLASLKQNLTIEPAVDFSITIDETHAYIAPDTAWQKGQSYAIFIGADYQSASGKQFTDRPTFHAGVREEPRPRLFPQVQFAGDRSYVINEARDMTLLFNAKDLTNHVPVVVETYRMPSNEKHRQQGDIYLNYDVPLSLLEKADTNVYLIKNGENRFSVPHPGEGAYIVETTYTDPHTRVEKRNRASYFVTPLSVYMQVSARDTLVWVNSSRTGGPVPGHKIFLGDSDEPAGVTDYNGMAIFGRQDTESDMEETGDFRIYDENGELVYFDYAPSHYSYGHQERYYSYLFLDRTLYRPEDTVSFWGFVQPFRNNQKNMPDTVTVTFDPGGLNIEQEISVSSDGIFSGEIELERIKSSQYSVRAALHFPSEEEGRPGEEHVIEACYISVKEFQKPAYTLSSHVGRQYYGPEDTVTVTAAAAFYDGTPMANAVVEASYYDAAKHSWILLGDVPTDIHGNATFSFPAWEGNARDGAAQRHQYQVRIASEGEDIAHFGEYTVFPSDILLDARLERRQDGRNLALTIEAFRLNLDSAALHEEFARGVPYHHMETHRLLELAKGERVDVEDLEISLRWDAPLRIPSGTRSKYRFHRSNPEESILFSDDYDFGYIIRQNPGVPIEIINHESGEKLLSVSTVNGSVTITDLIYAGDGIVNWNDYVFCRAMLSFKDTIGNTRSDTAYYPDYRSYREDWDNHEEEESEPVSGYSFEVVNLTEGTDITPRDQYWQYVYANVGDTLQFNLLLDGEPAPAGGRMLYCVVQDGIFQHTLTSGTGFNLPYTMAYGNSMNLVAVYFDGQGTRLVRQVNVIAHESSLGLDVNVTPDRESYRPGDTVRLNVRAADMRGNGVAANICVAVVDESIFALSEQYISILWDLYDDVRYTNNEVSQYFTAYRDEIEYFPRDGGKGGDGPGEFYDTYRSEFKDTAIFLPATTNAAGNATLFFQLPDNTTSWRITTVAVGGNLMAGSSKDNVISSLPFFVRPVMTTKYIEGDDFAMLVQGHGTLLDADSDIEYTVTVTGDNYSETMTAEGKAFVPQEMNFGKLPAGSYTVVSRAQHSGWADTVELPVSVIKSNLELVINREISLNEPLEIEATRYPVTISFYDRDIQPFITSINSLFGHYCMQASQRMSRVAAKKALRDSMPGGDVPSYIADTSENISDMQNYDGGISYSYQGGESNLRLTTYVLLIDRESFNLKAMADYYKAEMRKSNLSPIDAAAAHLGLAVIGDEAMTAGFLLEELEKAKTLDVKAYYIAALASIGETGTALRLYDEHCAPHIAALGRPATAFAVRRTAEDTAACWIAASLLRHDDADAISLYLGELSWRIDTLFECMIYVTHYDKVIHPSTMTYTVKGRPRTVSFGIDAVLRQDSYRVRGDYMHTVVLSRSDVESLQFTSVPENIRAVAYYIGEPSELGLEQSGDMSISKSIEAVDDTTYEVTLTIELGADAPAGQYDISDWVPSNTRLYDYDDAYRISENNIVRFATRSEMQHLYISFDRYGREQEIILYKYRVRKTFTSEAALDTVYMIHGNTGENCNSTKGTFRTS